MTAALTRPAVRWFGGKWKLAPWIISHFGEHRCYVEPFGGGASVLLRKAPSYAEVYNDLDGDIVNLFRVLRGNMAADLVRMVELTPFAREEFAAADLSAADPVERARQMLIRSFMGFGSNAHNSARKTGFRARSNRSGTTPARDWRNYPPALVQIIDRFRGVIVENRDALDVMAQHDATTTLHYVDPPYMHETRAPGSQRNPAYGGYVHEMSNSDHADLLGFLQTLKGAVLLSGYRCRLYDDTLDRWVRVERVAYADGARRRVECLWMKERAAALAPSRGFLEVPA